MASCERSKTKNKNIKRKYKKNQKSKKKPKNRIIVNCVNYGLDQDVWGSPQAFGQQITGNCNAGYFVSPYRTCTQSRSTVLSFSAPRSCALSLSLSLFLSRSFSLSQMHF